jgi:CheY-like chemotaxis protein
MMLTHTFDLVLMDLQMPIMDGKTATEKIRAHKIDTPIIALTANIEENLRTDLKNIGIYEVIQKPFVPADLYNKISNVIDPNYISTTIV